MQMMGLQGIDNQEGLSVIVSECKRHCNHNFLKLMRESQFSISKSDERTNKLKKKQIMRQIIERLKDWFEINIPFR